jgi:hypothetical protein
MVAVPDHIAYTPAPLPLAEGLRRESTTVASVRTRALAARGSETARRFRRSSPRPGDFDQFLTAVSQFVHSSISPSATTRSAC